MSNLEVDVPRAPHSLSTFGIPCSIFDIRIFDTMAFSAVSSTPPGINRRHPWVLVPKAANSFAIGARGHRLLASPSTRLLFSFPWRFVSDAYPAIDEAFRPNWDDPKMTDYDRYEELKK